MSDRYAVLHYAGDRRHLADGIDLADYTQPDGTAWPLLCGSDVFGRPYEVLDVDYADPADCPACHGATLRGLTMLGTLEPEGGAYRVESCDSCADGRGRSTVHLGPASTDTLKAHEAARAAAAERHIAERPRRIAFLALFSTPEELADLERHRAQERAAAAASAQRLELAGRLKRAANARRRRVA